MTGNVVNNIIEFDGFKVVLDPALHTECPSYIAMMAKELNGWELQCAQDAKDVLLTLNNDGSWTVEESPWGHA